MEKTIRIQTQPVKKGTISNPKTIGWCAINLDGIRIVFDAYSGYGENAIPRIDSLVEIITEKECFQLTPEYLVEAVKFFQKYGELGSNVTRFKNVFQVVMPDMFRDRKLQELKGLKF